MKLGPPTQNRSPKPKTRLLQPVEVKEKQRNPKGSAGTVERKAITRTKPPKEKEEGGKGSTGKENTGSANVATDSDSESEGAFAIIDEVEINNPIVGESPDWFELTIGNDNTEIEDLAAYASTVPIRTHQSIRLWVHETHFPLLRQHNKLR